MRNGRDRTWLALALLAGCSAPVERPRCAATTRVLDASAETELGPAGALAERLTVDQVVSLTYAGRGDVELAAGIHVQHILRSEPTSHDCPSTLTASVVARFATSDDVLDVVWDDSPELDAGAPELVVERVVFLSEIGPRWQPDPPATHVIVGLRARLEAERMRLVEAWVDVPGEGTSSRAAHYRAP